MFQFSELKRGRPPDWEASFSKPERSNGKKNFERSRKGKKTKMDPQVAFPSSKYQSFGMIFVLHIRKTASQLRVADDGRVRVYSTFSNFDPRNVMIDGFSKQDTLQGFAR
jgi:hypothetical protein